MQAFKAVLSSAWHCAECLSTALPPGCCGDISFTAMPLIAMLRADRSHADMQIQSTRVYRQIPRDLPPRCESELMRPASR